MSATTVVGQYEVEGQARSHGQDQGDARGSLAAAPRPDGARLPPMLGEGYSAHEEAAYALLVGHRIGGRAVLADRLARLGVLAADRRGRAWFRSGWLESPAVAVAQVESLDDRFGKLPEASAALLRATLGLAAGTPTEYLLSERDAALYGAVLWRLGDAFDCRRND